MKKQILSALPFLLIVVAMLWIYLSGAYHRFDFDYIQLKHAEWKHYAQVHPFLSALYFVGVYTVSVCLIIPDSLFLSLIGGFLFPLPLAILYIVLSETLGATLFVCAAEAAFKLPFSKHKNKHLIDFQKQVERNEVYYLLFLRFSHLLPFWLINLGAAMINIHKWTFIWTTFIGVLPLAIVLAQGGSGLSRYFEQHTSFSINDIFTPEIKLALIGLGLLALFPLLFFRLKKKP